MRRFVRYTFRPYFWPHRQRSLICSCLVEAERMYGNYLAKPRDLLARLYSILPQEPMEASCLELKRGIIDPWYTPSYFKLELYPDVSDWAKSKVEIDEEKMASTATCRHTSTTYRIIMSIVWNRDVTVCTIAGITRAKGTAKCLSEYKCYHRHVVARHCMPYGRLSGRIIDQRANKTSKAWQFDSRTITLANNAVY